MPELAMTTGNCVAVRLKPTVLAPKVARAFVRDVLSHWEIAEDRIWDACLVTSELVTNARTATLRHAPDSGDIRVCVSRDGGQVLIEVWDPSPVLPRPREVPAGEDIVSPVSAAGLSGWGLKKVVAGFSTSWYHTSPGEAAGGGKIVAARL